MLLGRAGKRCWDNGERAQPGFIPGFPPNSCWEWWWRGQELPEFLPGSNQGIPCSSSAERGGEKLGFFGGVWEEFFWEFFGIPRFPVSLGDSCCWEWDPRGRTAAGSIQKCHLYTIYNQGRGAGREKFQTGHEKSWKKTCTIP